ncbi:hypothetical protein BH09ACT10_BH09ACT10_06630 [soil metagenome]
MASKLLTLGAVGAGYVLGARGGRSHYEAIKKQATRVWTNPKVQEATTAAQDAVKDHAPDVKDKVAHAAQTAAGAAQDVAFKAASKVKSAAPGSSSETTKSTATDGATTDDPMLIDPLGVPVEGVDSMSGTRLP